MSASASYNQLLTINQGKETTERKEEEKSPSNFQKSKSGKREGGYKGFVPDKRKEIHSRII